MILYLLQRQTVLQNYTPEHSTVIIIGNSILVYTIYHEGFGTLDRKSIEKAMDILINLSGMNKLVGVISHREELIDNIPQQIRVNKTKEGSIITVENGL